MASVEKRYNKAGNLISFRIHVFHGRDEFGKQLPPFIKTVSVPPELNARQIETLIQRETVHFEEECELITAREKEEAANAAEPKCISFEDFAVKVMEIKERTGKEKSTLARYQDMLDSRINPYLGKTPVDEITGDMLDDFYAMLLKPGQNKKTGGGLSRKTVLEHHHVISTIMEHAIRKHLIAFNPCRDATPPVADPPMPNYYQPADLALIRQALENESVKWYTLIHVLMLYGIRRGECAGIKLSAVDLRGKTITICSCVMYDPKNGVYEKPYPKKRKPRQLPITPQMDEILRRYLKWRGEQPEWYGDLWQESGYLFTNEYGGPMNPDNITQYLNRMGDRLQKENPNFPHLNPHAFRHAVASILVANGTDIVTTAAFIGDKPATVSERYAHIIDSAKIRAGDTLSSVIFGDGNK